MNPSAASKGSSFVGAVGYITHDVGKDSSERVAYTEVLNMRTDDPEKAAKVMAWTALHASELKQAAGIKATGRKTENPVYHFSLNWEPGDEPSHDHMVDTAREALAVLGYSDHEAVLAVHTDKAHRHIHVVVNRINPETGKTQNPKNDYDLLQRWAYQYEKGRGNVVCLDRAIKFERDEALKAEYMRRQAAEIDTGKLRESKPRPQWEAERDASHPRSVKYRELKDHYRERVVDLSNRSRGATLRRAQEWQELKTKQAEQRAALAKKQAVVFKNRRAFGAAARPEPAYTWKAYQQDRDVLRQRHRAEYRALKEQLAKGAAPVVEVFKAEQKTAWREFFKFTRAADRGQLEAVVKLVSKTKVSAQGQEYRGHLSRLFDQVANQATREARFADVLEAQKRSFYAGLNAQQAPQLETLVDVQRVELAALRSKLDRSREASRTRFEAAENSRQRSREERQQLARDQKAERDALKDRHESEIKASQSEWAELTASRKAAWDDYKSHRAKQLKDRQTAPDAESREVTKTMGRSFDEARRIEGRDYMGSRDGTSGQGTGREVSRPSGRGGSKGPA